MKAISLFSGVGGMDLGFERAGIETVLQAERDPHCLEVLARHWPETERANDVRAISLADVPGDESTERSSASAWTNPNTRSLWANVDLVYGGFPCQDVSVAGKRAGLGGERSGLWFEFERVLRELRPRWAVIENVPGLLSSNNGDDFAVILRSLDELGFDAAWAVLDAQHFGVPQRRRRVFIVAGPRGRGAEQVLSLCESCGGNPETGRTAGEGITDTLGTSADRVSGATGPLAYALSASAGHHGHSSPRGDGSDNLVPALAYSLTSRNAQDRPESQAATLIAYSLNARDAKGPLPDRSIGNDGVANGVRRLTPLECERLMGWPDDWTRWTAGGREIADSHRYRMCGNGVVATVAEWIGHRLMAVTR